MIQVDRISKRYGKVQAVRDVSFDVGAREVVGFLGPNGAGKSTTLRIIAGFLGATSGRVRVAGYDTVSEPLMARSMMGYMPENVPLYSEMRVVEYLRFRAKIKGVSRKLRADWIERAMQLVRVLDHADVIIGQLSKGYRQRVGIADALVANPAVLVLDEPTAGLDPNQIREVRGLIRDLAKQHAVLLSTHIMSEVEASCDRAVVINDGQIVAKGTLEDLRKLRESRLVRIAVRGLAWFKAVDAVQLAGHVGSITYRGDGDRDDDKGADTVLELNVRWQDGVDTAEQTEKAIFHLVSAGGRVREAVAVQTTIEQVFALLTDNRAASGDEPALNLDWLKLANDRKASDGKGAAS